MKTAYGYARASTGKQNLTFDAQQQAIERYYKQKLEPEGYAWGGIFEDRATSGARPFTEREQGLRLFVAAQPGDAIIWAKMDRAFRSVRDGANTLHLLKNKGISIHSIDINLDTSTALGEFVCHLLMLLGELERSWVSSRTREVMEARRKSGQPMHRSTPAGWRIVGQGKTRALDVDHLERALINRLYDQFVAGKGIEYIVTETYHQKKRRACGDAYNVDFLLYAFHSKVLGYPVTYTRNFHKQVIRGTGRGRKAVLRRLSEFRTRADLRQASSA